MTDQHNAVAEDAPPDHWTALTDRQRDILRVAESLFSERGYKATTIRGISDALGLKPGSLYSHIESKEQLLYGIMLTVADLFCEHAAAAELSGGSARQRVRKYMLGHLEVLATHRAMATILVFDWRSLAPEQATQIKARRDAGEESLRRILADGVEAGEFVPDAVRWGRLVILSALNWATQWYDPDGPLSFEEIADKLCDTALHGLLAAA